MILIPIRLQDYSQAVKPLDSQEFEPDLEDLGGCTKVIDIKDKIQKARAEAHTIKSERINQVSCRGKIALGPDYLTTRAICTCCVAYESAPCAIPRSASCLQCCFVSGQCSRRPPRGPASSKYVPLLLFLSRLFKE